MLGAGIAEALRSIHRAGIVHRDLKPSNIRSVYVTNGTYIVHALDAATGTPRWSAPPDFSPDARGPRQETLHHHQDGAVPLVADGIVFVGGDDRLLRAYDAATGNRLWELPVDVGDDPGDSFLPVVDGGIAFVQDHREMTAIGARDGRIRWRAPVRRNRLGRRPTRLFTLGSDGRDKLTAFAPSPAGSSAAPGKVASSGPR